MSTYSLEMSNFLVQPELWLLCWILVSVQLWWPLVLAANKPCHKTSGVSAEPHTAREACASFSPAPELLEAPNHESFERASPQKTSSPWLLFVFSPSRGSESIRVQSKSVCQASRSGLHIYSSSRDHINICMEELTPDRFSIIRPNGSLLKSLHILWLCESLAPACLWEPLAHPAVCILFKQRWVSEQLDPEWRVYVENCSGNNGNLKL